MRRLSFHEEIEKNKKKSWLLTFLVFSFLLMTFYMISLFFDYTQRIGIIIVGFIFTISYILLNWFYGDKIILSSLGAKEAKEQKYLQLNNVVEELSIAAGIPKPKVYVIESPEMNAFAIGRKPKDSSIAITTGLLEKLNRDELSGVIGHEIAHISNYDVRFSFLVATLVGLVVFLSDIFLRNLKDSGHHKNKGSLLIVIGLVFALLAPIFVRLVQFAISRKREFLADATSAKLTRYPEGLASALEKIMRHNKGQMFVSEAISHLFFVDPNKTHVDYLFSTHPPIEERIRILRSM
ncbi:MAG: M48 family metallopeptidase [Candidatus Aenigmarchaeota archaeon]|nr:M48 family metallopeptidase [Candidatus Aenigmarchaeota archaeon]MCX8179190.1 M48 family metallopeptidase [Candidatus Aenigmarchaeota archaeon]MDW8149542.1 M48 family metallopeptidase [Candidatus Aenigmarchaeota archaeon]